MLLVSLYWTRIDIARLFQVKNLDIIDAAGTITPELLEVDSFLQVEGKQELVLFRNAGHPVGSTTYKSPLTAYYKVKMFRKAEALLKQMRKIGLAQSWSDEIVALERFSEVADKKASFTSTSALIGKSDLAESLIQEMREEAALSMVYELNSSIYIFLQGKIDRGCFEDISEIARDESPTHD
ncbi:hypothetical protein KPL71_017342 [Citrus sinensis]|uniref:Uncharacterized protein n=1 Tax=Citrus sinensis TaxID=2711 RepID=A0ACB8JNX7_CITSI|nr:hypothetical protein KPL71_017342 [Citrus sinensis]